MPTTENPKIKQIQVSGTLYDIEPSNTEELVFDDTPTANSDNPVKSGGIKSYVDEKLEVGEVDVTFNGTETSSVADLNNIVVGDTTYKVNIPTGALKFIGTTTTELYDGCTTNPITVNGQSVTASSGDVAIYGHKEFLWNGSIATPAWAELGDGSSYALKTVTVTGTGALSGGGSLAANRTITHNTSGVSAGTYQKVTVNTYGHITSGTTLDASDIPNIPASKITSGTIGDARIASAETWNAKQNALPTTSTAGKVLKSTSTAGTVEWGDAAASQVQTDWNQTDTSAVDYIKNKPTIPDVTIKMDKANPTGTGTLSMNNSNFIVDTDGDISANDINGGSISAGSGVLAVGGSRRGKMYGVQLDCAGSETKNQVITIPDATGTMALTDDIPTNVSAFTNDAGYLVTEDGTSAAPLPVNADTLQGHNAAYFSSSEATLALQTEINNLKSIGRFLAIWDATTGTPTSYPIVPSGATYPYTYTYKSGDYFRVGNVQDDPTENENIIPSGSSLVKATAESGWTISTTETTEELTVGDIYYFDGSSWHLQISSGGGTVQDVQVNGTSILNSGIANITTLMSKENPTGTGSTAVGNGVIASGDCSHAEGEYTTASGSGSHAEGITTTASGNYSHAEGFYTIANNKSQHVFGEYNEKDNSAPSSERGNYVEIVGKGTSEKARSNARTLDWSGNEVLAGKLTVGTNPTNDMDVVTKQYLDTALINVPSGQIMSGAGSPSGTPTNSIYPTIYIDTTNKVLYYCLSGSTWVALGANWL